MKLSCSNCQHSISIEDSKVPAGAFKVKCPKCGKPVIVQKDASASGGHPSAAAEKPPAHEQPPAPAAAAETSGAVTAAPEPAEPVLEAEEVLSPALAELVRAEVAAARSEILGSIRGLLGTGTGNHSEHLHADGSPAISGRTALVCEHEQQYIDAISATLKKLGYTIELARTTAEALKKLETGTYQVITLRTQFPDDNEGGQKILARINGQKPVVRRQTFVVLVSATIKSADANAAFFHGANITVNKEEIKNLEALIRDGQKNFAQIYRVFNQLLAEKD